MGSKEFLNHQLQQESQEIIENSKGLVDVLSRDRQALWAMLPQSTMSRLEYFCQLTPPSLSETVAGMLDAHLWTVVETALGFTVPKGENMGVVHVLWLSCRDLLKVVGPEASCQAPWLGPQKSG